MKSPQRLPGDATPKIETERAIRVDHAGEYGAVRIYEGQLAVLGASPVAEPIRHMAEQERAHLATFDALLVERRVRPTALGPLWHVAGFAMGAGTALLGAKAAMACTAAVEDVIDGHYGRQVARLAAHDPALCTTLARCQADEADHRETALAHGAEEAPGYPVLRAGISAATRAAIWLSERV